MILWYTNKGFVGSGTTGIIITCTVQVNDTSSRLQYIIYTTIVHII